MSCFCCASARKWSTRLTSNRIWFRRWMRKHKQSIMIRSTLYGHCLGGNTLIILWTAIYFRVFVSIVSHEYRGTKFYTEIRFVMNLQSSDHCWSREQMVSWLGTFRIRLLNKRMRNHNATTESKLALQKQKAPNI